MAHINESPPKQRGMTVFLIIWVGQLISTLGSGLTGFGLGVWLYQETGSVTLFALNSLAFTLPSLIVTPFAGALADRWDRRWLLILSDTGAGLSTLIVYLLFSSGQLEVWHIYLLTAFASVFTAFQWPAHTAATTMLVPKEQLGRASGLTQLGQAISQLASPAIAGALIVTAGLQSIILIDFITFLFAVLTLLVIRIPRPATTKSGEEGKGSIFSEAAYGWKYIRSRPGLMGLMLYFAVVNFFFGMIGPLFLPLMLNMTTADKVGYASSIMGVGMLVGTVVMSAWGGPKRRIHGVLGFGLSTGVFLALSGLRPSLTLITAAAFCLMFGMPILNGSSQALWQSKVAADVQGRVFAIRRLIAQSMTPLAIILAGPMADSVFEPLMNEGGGLADSVGPIIGVGPGRGSALLFIIMGLLMIATSIAAYSNPRVRLVEDELPDVVAEAVEEKETAVSPTTIPQTEPLPGS